MPTWHDNDDDDSNVSVYSHDCDTFSPCDRNDHGVGLRGGAPELLSRRQPIEVSTTRILTLASMPMIKSQTYPLHIVGTQSNHSRIGLHSLLNADPSLLNKTLVEILPLSLLNLEVPMGSRAWEVNGVVPVYDSGDMSSWMTVTRSVSRLRLDNDCCRLWETTITPATGYCQLVGCVACCPPLLIRLFLEQRKELSHSGCLRLPHTREGKFGRCGRVGPECPCTWQPLRIPFAHSCQLKLRVS
jgi:hypothetical protein